MPGISRGIFWFKDGSLFKGRAEGFVPLRALTTSEQLPPKTALRGESGALGKGGLVWVSESLLSHPEATSCCKICFCSPEMSYHSLAVSPREEAAPKRGGFWSSARTVRIGARGDPGVRGFFGIWQAGETIWPFSSMLGFICLRRLLHQLMS